MQRDDGVINHPFSMKLGLPWKPIRGCAAGLFDKRSLVKSCAKPNFKGIAGCQVIHAQWGRACGFGFHADTQAGSTGSHFSLLVGRSVIRRAFPEKALLQDE